MLRTAEDLDERDATILADRLALLDAVQGPRVGDFVRFPDDVIRRISHLWEFDDPEYPDSAQTSDGGHYYLGNGYVSMSGGLYPGVPPASLTDTGETAEGSIWFFHHDHHRAHNGVDVVAPFRVFTCPLPAPR